MLTDAEIVRLYYEEGVSQRAISRQDGRWPNAIRWVLRRNGVQFRPANEERRKGARISGRMAVENGKLALALAKARIVLSENPNILRTRGHIVGRRSVESGHLARVSRGIPTVVDGIQFRSQTEAIFFAVTQELGGSPRYEPLTIALSDGSSYTPDFILDRPVLGIPADVLIELKPSTTPFYRGNIEKAKRAGALILYANDLW